MDGRGVRASARHEPSTGAGDGPSGFVGSNHSGNEHSGAVVDAAATTDNHAAAGGVGGGGPGNGGHSCVAVDHADADASAVRRVGITRECLLAGIGSLLLAVLMTWPTLRDPASTIPHEIGDPALQAWQMAWSGHILTTDPTRLWQANASYPERYSFAFADTLLGYAPVGMIGHGPVAAVVRYNIMYVLVHAWVSFGAYVLLRQLGANRAGSALAAVAFAYAPWRLAQAGHLQILSTGGIALALAMLARGHGMSLRHGRRPADTHAGWALAGWLVAAWQITLGFGIGLPFAYVLLGALLVVVAGRLRRAAPGTPPGFPRFPRFSGLCWRFSGLPGLPGSAARAARRTQAAVAEARASPAKDRGRGVSGRGRSHRHSRYRASRAAVPEPAPAAARQPFPLRLALADTAGGLVFAGVGILVALPYFAVAEIYPEARQPVHAVEVYSPGIEGFLIAPAESWLWGDLLAPARATLGWPTESTLLPGFTLVVLAVVGMFASTWTVRQRCWLFAGAVLTVVLGIGTHFFGGRPGYLTLYDHLPGWDGLRTPGRLVLWTTLLLGILAAGAVSAFTGAAGKPLDTADPDAVPDPDAIPDAGAIPDPDARPAAGPPVRRRHGGWRARCRLAAPAVLVLLVLLEGVNTTPHPVVPTQPAALRTATPPVLVLPSTYAVDEEVMLWTTGRFQPVVNGVSSFELPRRERIRAFARSFPDAGSVAALRELGVNTVVVLRDRVAGTPWQDAADAPLTDLGVTRGVDSDAVVFHLQPSP